MREKDAEINIFKDPRCSKFQKVLDSEMKRLSAMGRYMKKSSDIISEEMEDQLWDLEILGDQHPQALLDTMFYYIGLYLALRGGEEHRRLRHSPNDILEQEQVEFRKNHSCLEHVYIFNRKQEISQ